MFRTIKTEGLRKVWERRDRVPEPEAVLSKNEGPPETWSSERGRVGKRRYDVWGREKRRSGRWEGPGTPSSSMENRIGFPGKSE